ncbi:MAG: DMT family transporter [Spirochaetia bacterium]|nr:DMT family transporter [Spirochaetia bacterium]
MLVGAAMIWGLGMVAQNVGMNSMGPFIFTFYRNLLAALVLLPFLYFNRKKLHHHSLASVVKVGFQLGSCLCAGYVLQTYGLLFTTVGKAGFITTLYIVFVPLFGVLFLSKIVPRIFYVFVFVALAGMYFLCIDSDFTLSGGDFIELAGALFFTLQILLVGKYSREYDVLALAFIEFLFSAVFSLVGMPFEHPTLQMVRQGAIPLLYAGICSSGIGMTFQVIGQKGVEEEVASLLMSLESVFALLAGFFVLHQQLSGRDILGCSLVFLAVMASQVVSIPSVKMRLPSSFRL